MNKYFNFGRKTISAPGSTKTPQSEFSSMESAVIGANEDILGEILSRLPVKSICRFKCVSKQWHSFIISPQFCHCRSRHHCKRVTRLFVRRQKPNSVISKYDIIPLYEFGKDSGASFSKSLKYVDNGPPMKILQSCNGLLCCRTCGSETLTLSAKSNYYVYNPTTLQFRKLPDPIHGDFCMVDGIESVISVHLAFDPRKSLHFKVLCVYLSQTVSGHYEMEIYSSETGQWRRTGDPFTAKVNFRSGIYWNGAINWFNLFMGDGLYFNVDEERFGKLPMLPFPDGMEERVIMYFGESYDHLHLVEYYGIRVTKFNLYEMDREYSGWFIRYHIDIAVVVNAFKQPTGSRNQGFKIVSVVSGENDEDPYVVLSIYGKAVRYNLVNKSFEKIWDFGKNDIDFSRQDFGWNDIFQYIESYCTVKFISCL